MIEKIQIKCNNALSLRGEIYCPDDLVGMTDDQCMAVFVHGFPGNSQCYNGVFYDMAEQLMAQGHSSLVFDARGCGQSGQKQVDYTVNFARRDMVSAIRAAKERGYSKFIFIGEGTGALLPLMDFAYDAKAFILLWPVIDWPHYAQTKFKANSIEDEWKKAGYILQDGNHVSIEFIKELQNTNIKSVLQATHKPVLIMHGCQDKFSPPEGIEFLRTHIGSRRIEITSFQDGEQGLTKDNHREAMLYHIKQFMEKYT